MNITQLLELKAISIVSDVIHKTIAMLHHVTTQVRDKNKYNRKHSVLSNIKQSAYKGTCI